MLRRPPGWIRRIFLAGVRASVPFTMVMATGAALSACGSSTPAVRFMPAQAGPAGECYYVVSAQECTSRGAVGIPTPMASGWLSTYYPFYSSSYYQSTYVPSDEQTEYQNDVSTFQSENEDAIADDGSDGDWTDTDGNTWSGSSDDDPTVSDDSSDDSGDDSDDGGDDGDSGDDDGGGDDDDDDGGDDDGGGDDD